MSMCTGEDEADSWKFWVQVGSQSTICGALELSLFKSRITESQYFDLELRLLSIYFMSVIFFLAIQFIKYSS